MKSLDCNNFCDRYLFSNNALQITPVYPNSHESSLQLYKAQIILENILLITFLTRKTMNCVINYNIFLNYIGTV